MRQKVGKERSQGVFAPLAIPRQYYPPPKTATYGRSLSTCRLPSEKFRPRARPPAPAYGVRCAPRPATLRVATSSVLKLAQVLPMAADATPRRKAGAERHSKIGFYSAKTAGVGFFPKIVTIRTPRAFLALLQTAPNGRASRRHPLRREVPLGTRKLEFAQTSPRAATRFWTKTASGHHISQPNELWPRAWGKFFRFNSSLKRGISLLRRGARVELSRRA